MGFTMQIAENETFYPSDDKRLVYSGRIDSDENGDPVFVFPCTFVSWRFKGTGASAFVTSERFYFDVYIGCIVDGVQKTFELPASGTSRIEIASGLEDAEHTVTLFKRQDACNIITFRGLVLPKGAELFAGEPLPKRRIEVYGDSVSAGEVSEAVECCGGPDPEGHEGRYSNAWYSYSRIVADRLNAQLHDIAQGGVALMDKTGWFAGPDYIGMESIYDKVRYYPDITKATAWDFRKYTPDVVIVAIGQNDANPDNFMASDYYGDKAEKWRKHYGEFIGRLRSIYAHAFIICTTTILFHDEAWDRAIDETVRGMNDPKVRHFLYSKNGSGTPGHIRIPEAEEMARELADYIESFGEEVWQEHG